MLRVWRRFGSALVLCVGAAAALVGIAQVARGDMAGGSRALGWGAFVVALAASGVRWNVPWARAVAWCGAGPTLALVAYDAWTAADSSIAARAASTLMLAAFVLGMGLAGLRRQARRDGDGVAFA